MKVNLQGIMTAATVMLMCIGATAWGSGVSGHTHAGNGELVKIEFQSGGKAITSYGPMSSNCTYTQTGKKIALTCEGDETDLNVGDDGSLNGPDGGMLAHLTKVK